MSAHKRVVEKLDECFGRQDWKGMLDFMTDDIERYEVGAPERIRGKKAFEENMKPGPEIASMRSKINRLTEEGNVVISEGTVVLTKKDGSSIHIEFCNVYEFEGDKVRREIAYAGVVPDAA
jgi:ketosteroid isomerase-like protein